MPRRKKSENDKPAGQKPRISQAEFQRSAESKRRSYASRRTSSASLASRRARPNWERPPSTMVVDDTTYQVLRHDLPTPKWSPNPCYLCSGHRVLSPYTFRLYCAAVKAIEWAEKRGYPAVEFPDAIAALRTRVSNEYGITAPYPAGVPIKCPACKGKGYGPQGIALTTLAHEIFYGGAKFGGKTACMTMWMVSGNPHLPNTNPDGTPNYVNRGYYFHPSFRGLVLRKNQEDLKAWIKYAAPIYRQLGAEHMRRDNSFEFPSGAMIWTGHLKDSDSYQKYMGMPELHRVSVEEVTQIPEEELYEQIRSCVRTVHPELRPQLFLDANPEGPGMAWVGNRFVHMKDKHGNPVPHKTIAEFEIENPFTKRKLISTRIFIPAGLRDNPYIDDNYLAILAGLPERMRKAYLEGDWDNLTGAFFSTFRNPLTHRLPFQGEPEKACHVIVKRKDPPHYPRLEYWWARQMGGDWGFGHECSYHWGCRDPNNGRLHIYREFGGGGISAVAQGVRIAELSRDELEQLPSHSLTLWYSRDAFQRRSNDEGMTSFVELISRGIAHVLGPDAIYVPQLNVIEEAAFDYDFNQRDRFHHEYRHFRESLLTQKKSGITIKMANSNRVLGWNYIRDGFEWADPIQPSGEFNPEVEHRIRREFGIAEAERYRQSFERRIVERPWLQIWDTCPRLLEAIPRAPADDRNPEDVRKQHWKGADFCESFRYLVTGFRDDPQEIPVEVRKQQAIEAFKLARPGYSFDELVMFNRHLEEQEKKDKAGAGYGTLGRRATMARRALQQAYSPAKMVQ